MYQILILALLAGAGYGYFTWSQDQISTLQQRNANLRMETEGLRDTMEQLQEHAEAQNERIVEMSEAQQKQEQEIQRYLSIFARHDLNKLAAAKPGLIETRVNNGTREVFETITNETSNTLEPDDSSTGVQPNSDG